MYIVPTDTVIDKELIAKAIKHNEDLKPHFDTLERYYLGEHKILNRWKVPVLANNKLMVNHARYIVDINVGYLLGNPVEYQVDEGQDIDPVLDQYKKQTIADIDHEVAKDISIFGKAYEYTYAVENDLHTKPIDVRNCVVIYDDTMEHTKLAAVLYESCVGEEYENVTMLTSNEIVKYNHSLVEESREEHYFGTVPVVEHRNNPEKTGDFEDVISLIDAYNTIQSDRVNDKEQLVEALLILYNVTLTDELKADLKANRIMSVPGKDVGAGAEYITKQLNEADTDVLRAVIEQDIHKISMTPNMSDENFVGNSSGVAIEYKLLPFEQNTKNKERYFEKGLLERFSIYMKYLSVRGKMTEIPIYDVDAVFKRNLPRNDLEMSQIINNLRGIVDDKTLVTQVSFVKDADQSLEIAQKETLERANALTPEFGTAQPNADPAPAK